MPLYEQNKKQIELQAENRENQQTNTITTAIFERDALVIVAFFTACVGTQKHIFLTTKEINNAYIADFNVIPLEKMFMNPQWMVYRALCLTSLFFQYDATGIQFTTLLFGEIWSYYGLNKLPGVL